MTKRAIGMRRVLAVVGQRRRAWQKSPRQKSEPPDAEERHGLREHQRLGQRIAEGVPRKAGEQMPAQPFRHGERDRQRQDAQWPTDPKQARDAEAEAGVKRQIGRQANDGDRQQPAEGLGVDQEGVADPIKAGDEIAEAEAPADARRGPEVRPSASGGTVDQPDQHGKGNEQHRPGIERRQRQTESAPATNAMAARRQP